MQIRSTDLLPFVCKCLQALLGLALTCGGAAAATATTTSSVNVRAGPATSFPTVTWFLSGTEVTIEGCLPDWRWCDVVAGNVRGWIYTRFLGVRSEGTVVTIRQRGASLGLPQTEFVLGPYWDAHYQDKVWFPRKAYFQSRWDRRTPAPADPQPASSAAGEDKPAPKP